MSEPENPKAPCRSSAVVTVILLIVPPALLFALYWFLANWLDSRQVDEPEVFSWLAFLLVLVFGLVILQYRRTSSLAIAALQGATTSAVAALAFLRSEPGAEPFMASAFLGVFVAIITVAPALVLRLVRYVASTPAVKRMTRAGKIQLAFSCAIPVAIAAALVLGFVAPPFVQFVGALLFGSAMAWYAAWLRKNIR